MFTGLAPSLMIDLAASAEAERQRNARDRDQRAFARRTRDTRRSTTARPPL